MALRWWLILLPLVAGSGCFTTESARPSTFVKRWQAGIEGNAVQLDVALIVRPIGDTYINRTLWTQTDEMVVDQDRQPALEANGLRVGQVVGMTPQGLQELLTSERWCVNPRRRLLPAGQVATQFLGSVQAQTAFEVKLKGQTQELVLDQARFCLDVTPHPGKNAGTRLQFLPKVEHGENLLPFKADPKQSTWVLAMEKPSKNFASFGWEIDIPSGALLVIGAHLDRPDSFGHRALVQEDGPERGQRLLVLRVTRSPKGRETGEPTLEDLARKSTSVPLALQAGMTAVRGSGQ